MKSENLPFGRPFLQQPCVRVERARRATPCSAPHSSPDLSAACSAHVSRGGWGTLVDIRGGWQDVVGQAVCAVSCSVRVCAQSVRQEAQDPVREKLSTQREGSRQEHSASHEHGSDKSVGAWRLDHLTKQAMPVDSLDDAGSAACMCSRAHAHTALLTAQRMSTAPCQQSCHLG